MIDLQLGESEEKMTKQSELKSSRCPILELFVILYMCSRVPFDGMHYA